jgi:hypothetical protein
MRFVLLYESLKRFGIRAKRIENEQQSVEITSALTDRSDCAVSGISIHVWELFEIEYAPKGR